MVFAFSSSVTLKRLNMYVIFDGIVLKILFIFVLMSVGRVGRIEGIDFDGIK